MKTFDKDRKLDAVEWSEHTQESRKLITLLHELGFMYKVLSCSDLCKIWRTSFA
jgi:hypothetical protein